MSYSRCLIKHILSYRNFPILLFFSNKHNNYQFSWPNIDRELSYKVILRHTIFSMNSNDQNSDQ